MQYGKYYQLNWLNAEKDKQEDFVGQQMYIRIYDMSLLIDDAMQPEVIELTPAGDPLRISTIDNSEDKFTPIRSIQATIKFLSEPGRDLAAFMDGALPIGGVDPGDPRWYVEIYVGTYGDFIFKGFINLTDSSEAFMPHCTIVSLTANDGLGSLKDIPLTNFDGNTPKGYYRIADYLAWALSKTKLELPLNAIYNIREAANYDKHFFDSVYLNSLTFEENIGTCHNCYEVISKILGEMAFLTQRGGEWWIVRVDEIQVTPTYNTIFDAEGNVTSFAQRIYYSKQIEKDSDIFFSGESTAVSCEQEHQSVKLTYRYEYPQELFCNIDFNRGTVVTAPDMAAATSTGIYEVECWKMRRLFGQPVTSTATIVKKFENGYERERYVKITPKTANGPATPWDFLESEGLPVNALDKVTITVNFRLETSMAGSAGVMYPVRIRLKRSDGVNNSWWNGADINNLESFYWTGSVGEAEQSIPYPFPLDQYDFTKWQTLTVELAPMPIDGTLYLGLNQINQSANLPDDQNIHFGDITINYQPYINGAYQKHNGMQHKVSSSKQRKVTREKQVYISDSPNKNFKGSLLKADPFTLTGSATMTFSYLGVLPLLAIVGDFSTQLSGRDKLIVSGTASNDREYTIKEFYVNGGNTAIIVEEAITPESASNVTLIALRFVLANRFYSAVVFNSGAPPASYIMTFAKLQAWDVWNQFRHVTRKFEGTMQGLTCNEANLDGSVNSPHLMHTYFLDDVTTHTVNRRFMLLTFEQDWRLCEWSGTLVESYSLDQGRSYGTPDALEVKYI